MANIVTTWRSRWNCSLLNKWVESWLTMLNKLDASDPTSDTVSWCFCTQRTHWCFIQLHFCLKAWNTAQSVFRFPPTLLWGIFFLSLLATFFPFFLRYWSSFPEDFNFLNFSASSNFLLSAVGKDKRIVNDFKVVNYNRTVYLQFTWSARMKLKKNHQENHQRPPRTKLKKKKNTLHGCMLP